MNYVLILFCVLSCSFVSAQVWEDSLSRAQELYGDGRFNEALDLYSKAKTKSDIGKHLDGELAQSAYRAGEFEKAKSAYSNALENEKDPLIRSRIHYNLGNSFLMNKEYDEAIENYKMAIRHNPQNRDAKNNLSIALRKKQKDQQENQNKSKNQDNKENPSKNKDSQEADSSNQKKSMPEFSFEKQSKENTLRDLMKRGEETRRRLNNQGVSNSSKGKDW